MVSEIGKVFVQSLTSSTWAMATPPPAAASAANSVVSDSFQSTSRFSAVGLADETLGQQAIRIRDAQGNLSGIQNALADIKNKLQTIVKQYPPYPLDSPQRILLLNQVEGLRKVLDTLTVPAPYRFPSEQIVTVADAVTKKDEALPEPGAIARDDLGLPLLNPSSASDTQVAAAVDQIVQAQQRVERVQQKMWQDVAEFVGQANAASAEQQSSSVRGYLARNPAVSIVLGNDRALAAAV